MGAEEREKLAEEKENKKAENAKRLAEKKRLEQEKKERWAAEARKEAEEQEALEAERCLIVNGTVISVSEMRKKGHILLEVSYGESEERTQVVAVDRQVQEGQLVSIALEGAE